MSKEDKVLRLIKGYRGSIKELAEATQIERSLLGKKLSGKTPMTVSELIRITEALKISKEELVKAL